MRSSEEEILFSELNYSELRTVILNAHYSSSSSVFQ